MLPPGRIARLLLTVLSLVGCSAIEHRSAPSAELSSSQPPAPDAVIVAQAPAVPSPVDPPEDRPAEMRIFSLRRHVWIRQRPSSRSPWIGYLGLGGAVRAHGAPLRGDGCDAFYAIEPRGFVCLDNKATMDPEAPAQRAIAHLAPRTSSAFLHDYGEAREAPRYARVPSHSQQLAREFGLVRHLAEVDALRSGGQDDVPPQLLGVDVSRAGVDQPSWLADLPVVHEYRNKAPDGSAVSFVSSFDAEGRTWLVTGDGALVPKDKVAPHPKSAFHGVVLDGTVELPIAFAREKARPIYARQPDGSLSAASETLDRLAWTRLSGRSIEAKGRRYWETAVADRLVDEREVVVVRASPATPWGDPVQTRLAAEHRRWPVQARIPQRSPRATWIEASVHEGWLIAYEGDRPVYVTLAASGRGDPAGSSGFVQTSTATGVFAIQGKYLTETMDIGATVHFDVPFTMPYHNSYAIHAAYWHDRWGEKVSLGCLNLSPLDARWLFDWAEPAMPAGWHGITTLGSGSLPTVVIVHA